MNISCLFSCNSAAFQDNVSVVVMREGFRCKLYLKQGPDAS